MPNLNPKQQEEILAKVLVLAKKKYIQAMEGEEKENLPKLEDELN